VPQLGTVWGGSGFHHTLPLQRSYSAECSVDDTATRDRRISRALYRQLLRWCQVVQNDALPADILQHFLPPNYLAAPEQIDPYRMELLFAASTGADDCYNQSDDAVVVRRALSLLPTKSEYSRKHLTVSIHSVTELRNVIRAVFRLNNVGMPVANDDLVAHESLQEYQTKRRNAAFQALKSLNELYSEELQQLKKRHAKHAVDRENMEFVVGQVVQHRHDRWRGVVAAWDKQPSYVLSDDFSKTSLTTKEYVTNSLKDRVRYNVLLDVGDSYNLASMTGWSLTDQSDLVAVTDKHLCRIRNNYLDEHFCRYNAETGRFVPNSLKAYEFPSDVDDYTSSQQQQQQQRNVSPETQQLCEEVIQGVQSFATQLEALLLETAAGSSTTQSLKPFTTLRGDLTDIATGNVVPGRHRFDDLAPTTTASLHVRALLNLSHGMLETMLQRRVAVTAKDKLRFKVGDVVLHKKYGYRGVIVAWDPTPTVAVSRWDGLQDIPNPEKIPFYQVIPDQSDCIEAFGGERSLRYVCEENLEPCPRDRMLLDVDLDPGWEPARDGSYLAPAGVLFKYGADLGDDGVFERCMVRLEGEINRWQYQARDPAVDDETVRKISLANMLGMLQVVDNMDDAAAVQDTIKEMRKAHPSVELRSRLEQGITALVAGKAKDAREIYLAVIQDDPEYAEGWNKLATCEYMIGKHEESFQSTRRVLELEPMHYQAKNGLGLLHFEKKEYLLAADCFRESLDIDPWCPVAAKLAVCVDFLDQVVLEDELPF
jgi:hemimethylated DNA binding protein